MKHTDRNKNTFNENSINNDIRYNDLFVSFQFFSFCILSNNSSTFIQISKMFVMILMHSSKFVNVYFPINHYDHDLVCVLSNMPMSNTHYILYSHGSRLRKFVCVIVSHFPFTVLNSCQTISLHAVFSCRLQ